MKKLGLAMGYLGAAWLILSTVKGDVDWQMANHGMLLLLFGFHLEDRAKK